MFFFLFFIFFSVLASRVTPVALLFARRTASGSWRVWRHGVPPTVRTCPMCTPACPSTCLGWTQRWQTEQMGHIEKISLSHSEINKNKKPNKSSFPSLFPQDTNSIYTGIQVRLVVLISLVLSLQTYYVPKVCLKAKGTLKNKIERVMYFCL